MWKAKGQSKHFHYFARNSINLLTPGLSREMYRPTCTKKEVKLRLYLYRSGQALMVLAV
jgi:hypothetical protein